jgi:succinate dehydrogenase/fumarate reductase flavoprotein subunit
MQLHASVFRTEDTLLEGCKKISDLCRSFDSVKVHDKDLIWNTDLIETLELENLLMNSA